MGDVAQLGERRPCKAEVVGSIPIVSTGVILQKRRLTLLTESNVPDTVPRSPVTTQLKPVRTIFDNLKKSKWHLNCVFSQREKSRCSVNCYHA